MVFDSFFNTIFGWAIDISPEFGIVAISLILTLMITIIYKFMTDQEMLKNIKQEMKDIRKEIKSAAQNPEKMAELNKKSIEKSMIQMKHTLKPTLFTMLPLLLIFVWLRNTYQELTLNFFGITSWLWAYIILSIVFSIVLRKLLKVH